MVNQDKIKTALVSILEAIGEEPSREGIKDTPQRVAAMYVELFSGMDVDPKAELAVDFAEEYEEMVILRDISFYSMCEHHLLPFIGKCHIGYLPSGKVLGLSKFARIVDMFARRMQIQENLTRQIAEAVQQVTNARGVAVVVEAKHLCMMMRGVEKQNSSMTSSVMLGAFRDNPSTRHEFLTLVNGR